MELRRDGSEQDYIAFANANDPKWILRLKGTLTQFYDRTSRRRQQWNMLSEMAECALSAWSEWSECNQTCDQQVQIRHRNPIGEYASWKLFASTMEVTQQKNCPFKDVCPVDDYSSSDYY